MGTNEKVQSKGFLDNIHDVSSCAVCQCILKGCSGGLQSVTSRSSSTAEIRESEPTVYSTSDCRLGRNRLFNGKEQQAGSTSNGVKAEKESQVLRPDTLHNDCFIASSYYGGPDELVQGINHDKIEMKAALKELEKAEDPFDLYCTTRGNWWEGSLYY